MENKIILQFVRYSSFVLLFIACTPAAQADRSNAHSEYPAIYYGDSEVNIGDPFAITCIISISDPIEWFKDGETLTKHNLRHGRDEHAYIETENVIEGEGDKIEATITVRHALTVHEGKYQCNAHHPSYHFLRVRRNDRHSSSSTTRTEFVTMAPHFTKNRQKLKPNPEFNENRRIYADTLSPDDDLVYKYFRPSTTVLPLNYRNSSGDRRRVHDYGDDFTLNKIDKINSGPTTIFEDFVSFDTNSVPPTLDGSYSTEESEEVLRISQIPHRKHSQKHGNFGASSTAYPRMTTSFEKFSHENSLRPSMSANRGRSGTTRAETESSEEFPVSNPMQSSPRPPKIRQKDPSDMIVPNYDIVESKLKAFVIKSPLLFTCNITEPGKFDLIWTKNGTEVSKVSSLNKRYEIKPAEHTLFISRALQEDDGQWACTIKQNNQSKEFNAVANVYVSLSENIGVVEGETLTINCLIAGTEPIISWKVGENITITESTGRYILKESDTSKIPNGKFIIEVAEENDRNHYSCIAKNQATILLNKEPVVAKTFVRVKGKLAALWPFLGICAEVFILCAIILIYEKRRNKTELDESDTDPNTEQRNDQQGKDSEVRQRK